MLQRNQCETHNADSDACISMTSDEGEKSLIGGVGANAVSRMSGGDVRIAVEVQYCSMDGVMRRHQQLQTVRFLSAATPVECERESVCAAPFRCCKCVGGRVTVLHCCSVASLSEL